MAAASFSDSSSEVAAATVDQVVNPSAEVGIPAGAKPYKQGATVGSDDEV